MRATKKHFFAFDFLQVAGVAVYFARAMRARLDFFFRFSFKHGAKARKLFFRKFSAFGSETIAFFSARLRASGFKQVVFQEFFEEGVDLCRADFGSRLFFHFQKQFVAVPLLFQKQKHHAKVCQIVYFQVFGHIFCFQPPDFIALPFLIFLRIPANLFRQQGLYI